MSAAERISQRVARANTRLTSNRYDDSLAGETSELLARLRKIRARSTATTQGSSISTAPLLNSSEAPSAAKRRRVERTESAVNAHDELRWQDNLLTWTRGSTLVRTFSFSSPVLQAFWTLFSVTSSDSIQTAPGKTRANQHTDPPVPALCVFFEQAVHIHFPGIGEQVDMGLPFRFARAFPAPVGFLIQRQIESEDERIASRLQRPATSTSLPQAASSSFGYPFPDLSNSSDSSYSLSHLIDETDEASASQLHQDATRLLPMVFYLSRCYDDLVPVDRFPQLSFSLSPSDDPKPITHGPASPFGEMDEVVVFVSAHNDQHLPPYIVTTSARNSAVRVYAFAARPEAFEATPALLSTPRVPSSLTITTAGSNGATTAAGSQPFGIQSHDDDPQPMTGHARTLSDTNGAISSTALGRGFPTTIRKSARIDLERRTSGMISTAMGRDPSGRSRRISAMHSGAGERRSTGRKDDQAGQARDRTLANISHTADGLRLQSQAYPHDAMMDELGGGGGTSMRITTNPTPAVRLRRSSQAAARTPYGGPRNSNRTSTSAVKSRPSMNLSRLDTAIDPTRFSSTIATGTADGIRADAIDADTGITDDDDVDLAHIADMDSFARSFACVCLLDEIKIEGLSSAQHLANLQVSSATFERLDPDAAYLFLSVPAISQTFCRRLGYQRLGSQDRSRKLPFCKPPAKLQAASVIPSAALAPIQTLAPHSTEVLTMSSDGTLQLHFAPPSTGSEALDISAFGPLAQARDRLAGQGCSIHLRAATAGPKSCVQLASAESQDTIDVDLDFRPRCPVTARVLKVLAQTVPSRLVAKIKSRWIQTRFLAGAQPLSRYGRAAFEADWAALSLILGSSPSPPSVASEGTRGPTAHSLFGDDSLLRGLVPLSGGVDSAKANSGSQANNEHALERDEAGHVLLALYLLAEETRLDASHPDDVVSKVAHLAAAMAQRYHSASWVEAIHRRLVPGQPDVSPGMATAPIGRADAGIEGPPTDLYQVLLNMASGSSERVSSLQTWIATGSASANVTHASSTFPVLDAVLRVFSIFGEAKAGRQPVRTTVVESMISNGLDLETLRRLPFGIALPLYQAIRACQIEPPSGKSAEFYHMIQRAELALNASAQRGSLSTANARQIPEQLIRTLPEDAPLDAICAQLFSRDFRLRDVVAMLKTDSLNSVYVSEGENQTEAAITEQHNAAVAAIGERTKALPPGRAMLFMTSRHFSPTHKWRIPSICLAVKVRPRGTTIEPDTKAESAGLDWPEFHNGVASVLELNLAANVGVDSKWIFAHLGEQVTARHAGFLYGLGLMKQLPTLTPVHVFRYLKMRNNLLTIGFLLGMAVSTVGTADPTARHLIGMQLTAFLPPGSAPLNLSTITQTAGLLAMGLVFLGSNHRWTAKRMLDQIGAQESPTPNIQPQHREAHSLSAGLALGLVYLGKGRGDGMKSLPDKRIVARLVHLIKGSSGTNEGLSLAGSLRPDEAPKEGLEVNLTSAPAALAFGLIYLRSNSRMIADVMAPPRTPRELDMLRPDVHFVHVLSRSLILWDTIQPSNEWLHSMLPTWLQERIEAGKPISEAAQLAQINMEAGACFAIGLKFAGSKDQKACECLWQQLHKLDKQVKVQTVSFFSKIRKAAIQAALDQARISLALVLAGSGDVDLLRHLRRAHGDVEGDVCYGSHMASHMALGLLFLGGGRFTLGTSDLAIAALLISFLPPFPRWSGDNRAHLQAFRHLWFLAIEPRLLIATDVETNQLVSLPIQITAGDKDSSEWHASTPLLLPIRQLSGSIQTATDRYWPASIDSSTMPGRTAASGSLAASTARASASTTSQMLFVQRKTAHLDYLADPHGSRSLSSRAVETAPMDLLPDATELIGPGVSELREALRGLLDAGKQRELVRTLCLLSSPSHVEGVAETDAMAPLMRAVAMECLTMDKMYMLPAYASIVQLQQTALSSSRGWLRSYRDVRFADEFYQRHYARLFADGVDSSKHMPLVQVALLTTLRRQAQQQARELFDSSAALRDTITNRLIAEQNDSSNESLSQAEVGDFWTVLVASETPDLEEVRDLIQSIKEYIRTSMSAIDSMDDGESVATLQSRIRMVTDAAFGGADRAPWTSYVLDHVVDRLLGSL
ncbi:related to negative regulator of mitosis [Sporisorium reilianum SRZ2]|uniref:Related to negative regulator of mitosis n=1 Tax=Sporisorium reilianum (strain SRZ2) TaxID=999809 RepID=E6ZVB3_SPORE|nr:related to negative regulator of mitosis [Sporisorium reilianum SRZ2]